MALSVGVIILAILDLTVHQYWHEFLGPDPGAAAHVPSVLFQPLLVAVSSPTVSRVRSFRLL